MEMRREGRRWRRGAVDWREKERREAQSSHSRLLNINIRFPQLQGSLGSCQDGTSVPATRRENNLLPIHWPSTQPSLLCSTVIRASLSKPHTSVTALHTHVCIYACLFGPTTYRKF